MKARTLTAALLVTALALGASACGSSTLAPAGLVIAGPGVRTSQPPWSPEYAHLGERLRKLGLPPGGDEKFHIHAMLHIYVEGLLVPLPADIGLDPAKHTESSLHTHDRTGIIHMEAAHAYNFTLGDFFAVWGVKLGPAQLGGLTGYGGDKLHFYLNGKPLKDPATHVLRNGDSIVIGYGALSSFPHNPSTFLLDEIEHGKGGLGCSSAPGAKHARSCLTSEQSAGPHDKRQGRVGERPAHPTAMPPPHLGEADAPA
jgi:hypothetical protein